MGKTALCNDTERSSAWALEARNCVPITWTCSKVWYSMLHKGKKDATAYTKVSS